MAEVRSKMSDVKSQVLEARGSVEARPGPSGAFGVEEMLLHHGDSEMPVCRKPSELDSLVARAAAARSRPCRPGTNYVMKCAQACNIYPTLKAFSLSTYMHMRLFVLLSGSHASCTAARGGGEGWGSVEILTCVVCLLKSQRESVGYNIK